MTDYGIKISKIGASIDSTNIDDYIFLSSSSVHATAMIVNPPAGGTATVPSSSYVDVSISHNLNYIPTSILYTEPTPGSGRWYMGVSNYGSDEDTYISPNVAYTYCDDTYLKFRIINNTASQKIVSYYYFILGESGI